MGPMNRRLSNSSNSSGSDISPNSVITGSDRNNQKRTSHYGNISSRSSPLPVLSVSASNLRNNPPPPPPRKKKIETTARVRWHLPPSICGNSINAVEKKSSCLPPPPPPSRVQKKIETTARVRWHLPPSICGNSINAVEKKSSCLPPPPPPSRVRIQGSEPAMDMDNISVGSGSSINSWMLLYHRSLALMLQSQTQVQRSSDNSSFTVPTTDAKRSEQIKSLPRNPSTLPLTRTAKIQSNVTNDDNSTVGSSETSLDTVQTTNVNRNEQFKSLLGSPPPPPLTRTTKIQSNATTTNNSTASSSENSIDTVRTINANRSEQFKSLLGNPPPPPLTRTANIQSNTTKNKNGSGTAHRVTAHRGDGDGSMGKKITRPRSSPSISSSNAAPPPSSPHPHPKGTQQKIRNANLSHLPRDRTPRGSKNSSPRSGPTRTSSRGRTRSRSNDIPSEAEEASVVKACLVMPARLHEARDRSRPRYNRHPSVEKSQKQVREGGGFRSDNNLRGDCVACALPIEPIAIPPATVSRQVSRSRSRTKSRQSPVGPPSVKRSSGEQVQGADVVHDVTTHLIMTSLSNFIQNQVSNYIDELDSNSLSAAVLHRGSGRGGDDIKAIDSSYVGNTLDVARSRRHLGEEERVCKSKTNLLRHPGDVAGSFSSTADEVSLKTNAKDRRSADARPKRRSSLARRPLKKDPLSKSGNTDVIDGSRTGNTRDVIKRRRKSHKEKRGRKSETDLSGQPADIAIPCSSNLDEVPLKTNTRGRRSSSACPKRRSSSLTRGRRSSSACPKRRSLSLTIRSSTRGPLKEDPLSKSDTELYEIPYQANAMGRRSASSIAKRTSPLTLETKCCGPIKEDLVRNSEIESAVILTRRRTSEPLGEDQLSKSDTELLRKQYTISMQEPSNSNSIGVTYQNAAKDNGKSSKPISLIQSVMRSFPSNKPQNEDEGVGRGRGNRRRSHSAGRRRSTSLSRHRSPSLSRHAARALSVPDAATASSFDSFSAFDSKPINQLETNNSKATMVYDLPFDPITGQCHYHPAVCMAVRQNNDSEKGVRERRARSADVMVVGGWKVVRTKCPRCIYNY